MEQVQMILKWKTNITEVLNKKKTSMFIILPFQRLAFGR